MSISAHTSAIGDHATGVSLFAWSKPLLACGVAALLLYFAMDVLAAWRYDGYSYTDQTISELSAIGAPTRGLWTPLGVVYSLLTIACAGGIWASAGRRRALRFVAVFVAGIGVLGLVGWPFAPMHQREVLAAGGGTLRDTMHLTLAAISTLLFVSSIAFGSTALGKRFRWYSIATLVVVLVFGAVTAMDSSKVSDNDPTPWLGISERIAVFGSMAWIAVLSIALLPVHAPDMRDAADPS
jgi:hypothetical protein